MTPRQLPPPATVATRRHRHRPVVHGASPEPGAGTSSPSRPAADGVQTSRTVRLVTHDAELAQAVEAVCVSAGVALSVVRSQEEPGSGLVLVDGALAQGQLPQDAMVIGLAEQPGLWETAAACGARAVVVLPQAAEWLAETLSRQVTGAGTAAAGAVIGVTGAVGGAGASTFACWLAQHLSGTQRPTALVDLDPTAVGVDLVLGAEEQDGLRWPELRQFSGAIAGDQLWAAMPAVDSLRYLSWDRSATNADSVPMGPVVAALRQAAGRQVLDLAIWALEERAAWCDVVVVVTPRTVRGVLAAAHAVTRCGATPAVTVLSGLDVADVDAAVIESATGVPCVGTIGFDPRVPQALDNGTVRRRGRATRHAKAVAGIAAAVEALL